MDNKKRSGDLEAEHCCPSCLEIFATNELLLTHKQEHKEKLFRPEKLFFFMRRDGVCIPLNEKHALVFGPRMQEYLGMIETADPLILEKTADEIRAMNLPRVVPVESRRTLYKSGVHYDMEVPYSTLRGL